MSEYCVRFSTLSNIEHFALSILLMIVILVIMTRSMPTQRDVNLDYIKALAISLVLLWHDRPVRIYESDHSSLFVQIIKFALELFYYNITLIAVPLFIMTSLYILFIKLQEKGLAYTKKRSVRVGGLYLFWTALHCLCYYLSIQVLLRHDSSFDVALSFSLQSLLMEGGPFIPGYGASVFYFLFVLFALIPLSSAYFALRTRKRLQRFAGIGLVAVSLLSFEYLSLRGSSLNSNSIMNFVIYIPLANYLLLQKKSNLRKLLPLLLAGFILFTLQDGLIRLTGKAYGGYSRVSLVFGACLVFCFLLQLRDLKTSPVVFFLSKYSLGIFATHKYWHLLLFLASVKIGMDKPFYISGLFLDLRALTVALISTTLTIVGILLTRNTILRKVIS